MELIALTKAGMNEVSSDAKQQHDVTNISTDFVSNTTSVSTHSGKLSFSNTSNAEKLGFDENDQSLEAKEVMPNANDTITPPDTIPKGNKSKKKKVPSEFSTPSHLIPLASDTEGERNKKRRTPKALKSKWR